MVSYDDVDWKNPSWEHVKYFVHIIDTYDCGAGQVANALQLLTTWIENNSLSQTKIEKEEQT